MLRNNCHFYNQQQNNGQLISEFEHEIKMIEDKVEEYSTQIQRQYVESSLNRVEDDERIRNRAERQKCFEELECNLEMVLNVGNCERALRRRKRQNELMKKEEERNYIKDTLGKKWNENPFLFRCEDIFLSS